MKKYLIFLILILMLSTVFSLTFIGTYSNDPDKIYGVNDNIINITSRWSDAEYVIANFSNVDKPSAFMRNITEDNFSIYPTIATLPNGTLFLVYNKYNVTGCTSGCSQNLVYKTSVDGGQIWSSELLITNNYNGSFLEELAEPDIKVASNGDIHIAFHGYIQGQQQFIYHVTNANGVWVTRRVSGIGRDNVYPRLAITSDNKVHVVWIGDKDGSVFGGDQSIFYSKFDGSTWSPRINLYNDATDDPGWQNPKIISDNLNLHIAFFADDGTTEHMKHIMYDNSKTEWGNYDGGSWNINSSENVGTSNSDHANSPALGISHNATSREFWVVWQDIGSGDSGNDSEIYGNELDLNNNKGFDNIKNKLSNDIVLDNNIKTVGSTVMTSDGIGDLHLFYRDSIGYDLHYMYYNGNSWGIPEDVVDSGSLYAVWPEVSLDKNHNPILTFVKTNWSNLDVKFFKKDLKRALATKESTTKYKILYGITSSPSDGNYIIPITASGSKLTNSSFTITIDNTEPNITIQNQNPLIIFEYTNVNLSTKITDVNNLSQVLILGNWEGFWKYYNVSGNINHTNFSYMIDSSYLQSRENVSWRFFAKDKANNFKNGTLKSFVVKNRTQILLDPGIPDGKNDYYITLPLIILKFDPTANSTYYRWDALELLKYTGPFYFNWSNTFGGIEVIHFFSEFSGSSVNETSQNKTIKVDITKPEIQNINPPNNSVITTNLINISALLDDIYESNSGINESSVILKINNQRVNATILNISKQKTIISHISSLFNGTHNISLYVEDNAGLSNYLNWTFSVNTSIFLNVTVYSPTNKIYNDTRLLINISLSKEANEIQYKTDEKFKRLCKDCQNYTKKKTFNEGNNTITIRVIDEFNNYNERTINSFIDSKEPKIKKVDPKKGFSNGTFLIKYKEENLKQITLFYNNTIITKTDCPSSNKSDKEQECLFPINLSSYENQEVSYYFQIEDIAGNKDASKNYTITSDTKPSLITINEPLNKTYNKYVIFNITLDSEADLRYIENNKKRILCNKCSEYGFTKQKKKRFSNGLHNLTIISIDKAGNSNTKNIQFEVI